MATETTFQRLVTMVTESCCNCGVLFSMPSDLHNEFRNDPEKWFYCPIGCKQHYSKSQATIERERLERQLREKENQLISAANQRLQLEQDLKKANRKLKRVSKGVCPCCNRTFQNLASHMKTQHPEIATPK